MSSVGACKNALTNPARYGTVNAQTRNSTIRARLPDQPKNNDGCEIFRMNGKAAEPRVRGLMLLVPEDFFVFRRADENIRGVQNERRKMEAVFVATKSTKDCFCRIIIIIRKQLSCLFIIAELLKK